MHRVKPNLGYFNLHTSPLPTSAGCNLALWTFSFQARISTGEALAKLRTAYFVAQLDAFVADVHAGACDELSNLALVFSAERAREPSHLAALPTSAGGGRFDRSAVPVDGEPGPAHRLAPAFGIGGSPTDGTVAVAVRPREGRRPRCGRLPQLLPTCLEREPSGAGHMATNAATPYRVTASSALLYP